MRIKSAIWVMAYIRRCAAANVPAVVVCRGDDSAGVIYIKINRLDGTVALFGPAPAGVATADGERLWAPCLALEWAQEPDADAYLARQREFDPDYWLIEVEDRKGRDFLEGSLARD
ncbi:MAG: DUF1491 family protein [Pseudomonadota bacterium]|nr:DUF1491 family protein [Pseudomonadota bacterium]